MTPNTQDDIATLYTLGDRGQTIDGTVDDVRGRTVKDTDGTDIGMVADLLIDDHEQHVRFLVVEHNGFLGIGETRTLVPVEAITTTTADEVLIDQSREHVTSAPAYVPSLINDQAYHASIYHHYGHASHWGHGYLPPRDGMYHL
ncbi:PRC-barrel domain-containing protein [Dermatophilaceae bacterium Sec6.4]